MTEEQYIKFLKEVYLTANGKHLSDASMNKYSRQTTKKIDYYIKSILPDCGYESIYDINSIEELKEIKRVLYEDPSFKAENEKGNHMYSAGLEKYIMFAEGSLISKFCTDTSVLDIKEPIPRIIDVKPRRISVRDTMKVTQAKGACKYCCQIDDSHKTFISMTNKRNYVEGHHIIPISFQSNFNYSLDVLANIIVLCPNCHRLLHYAIKQERIDKLYQIYDERYERFNNAGILTDRQSFIEMAIG